MADIRRERHASHADLAWTWPQTPDESPRLKGGSITYRDTIYEDGKPTGYTMLDPRDVDFASPEITALIGSELSKVQGERDAALARAETAEADARTKTETLAARDETIAALTAERVRLRAQVEELTRPPPAPAEPEPAPEAGPSDEPKEG